MARSPNYSPKHPALRVQESTVRAAVIRAASTLGARPVQSQPSAQLHTEPLTLDDGTIVTRHPFMWGVDSWGDPSAVWKHVLES